VWGELPLEDVLPLQWYGQAMLWCLSHCKHALQSSCLILAMWLLGCAISTISLGMYTYFINIIEVYMPGSLPLQLYWLERGGVLIHVV